MLMCLGAFLVWLLVILGFPFGKLSLGQTQIFLYTCKAEKENIYIKNYL